MVPFDAKKFGAPFTVGAGRNQPVWIDIYVPEDALRAQRAAATDSLQQAFATLMLQLTQGDDIPMRETLEHYGLQFTTVRDYARVVTAA